MGRRGADDGREGRLMRPVVLAIAIVAGAWYGLSVTPPAASAQDWPTRPIKIITPLAAGSAPISSAAPWARRLRSTSSDPVVMEPVRRRRRARGTDRRTRGAGRRDVAARNGRGFDDRARAGRTLDGRAISLR